MSSATETVTPVHTVVSSCLGDITLVRDADALVGSYFQHRWYVLPKSTFGVRTDHGFDEIACQLREYLAGHRRTFDLQLEPRGDDIQQRVWDTIRHVPFAHTRTYAELVDAVGDDVSEQQVRAAVAHNPLGVFIPTHRIVGHPGELAGYARLLPERALRHLEQSTTRSCRQNSSQVVHV